MQDLAPDNLEARIQHATLKAARVARFVQAFPPLPEEGREPFPSIHWAQIERQLLNLAGPDFDRAIWEIKILKASARTSPPEMVIQDILKLAWSLIDGASHHMTTLEVAMD